MSEVSLSWCTALLAVVIAFTPRAALANDAQERSASDDIASMPRLAVTITATRNPVKTFEYPGMVSVIDGEEILRRQASTPDDLLQFVPNVEFTGGPRRTGEVPSIRGFSGADVIVTFDGARQNFGSAHDGSNHVVSRPRRCRPTEVRGTHRLRNSSKPAKRQPGTQYTLCRETPWPVV